MPHLIAVSLIWAFSFGLIKRHLAGLDPSAAAAARLAVSLLVFLPLLRLRDLPGGLGRRLAAVGFVQYGLMYLFYLRAFESLAAHEVALFTVFTPLWVTLFEDASNRRMSPPRVHLAAGLAVAGTLVIVYRDVLRPGLLGGFLLVQLSNACFAAGQIAFRRLRERYGASVEESRVFALLYAGALAAAVPAAALSWDASLAALGWRQAAVLLYLGAVASGLGFFLWNVGATRVGAGALAVMNNAKTPLGVAAALLFFGEAAHLGRLLAGGALLGLGLFAADRRPPQ